MEKIMNLADDAGSEADGISKFNTVDSTIQAFNVISFIICIVMNGASSKGGKQKKVSDKNDQRLAPAPLAFSIWGIIYLLMLVFTIYQAIPEVEGRNNKLIYHQI